VAAPLLAGRLGLYSLAIGLLAGSLAPLAVMAVDVHRAGVRVTWSVRWGHPALRRMLWLYLPIAAGLVVNIFQVGLDRRLASGTGAQSIAWMANATTLQQMPLGLISVAISLAALPRLSQYFAAGDDLAFRRTLAQGLRLLWLLMVPAALLLWVLGRPVTELLFQRGAFTAADTDQVVQALNIYLIGMVFAAVDFPLNFAFYARQNTWLPALVGVASVGIYVAVALRLVEPLGYLGLVWADTAKQAGHLLIMVLLLWRVVGALRGGTIVGFLQVALATGGLALVVWPLSRWLSNLLPAGQFGNLLWVGLTVAAGLLVYGLLLWAMRMPEARQLWGALRQRLGLT
jgi:putative peptidoglycan lipid II flippase